MEEECDCNAAPAAPQRPSVDISEAGTQNVEVELSSAVADICQQFHIAPDQLEYVSALFRKDIDLGLARQTHDDAIVKCLITYVQDLPSGNERGNYLALDLGGTNFRVLLVNIRGANDIKMDSETFEMPTKLITGPGSELFDYIAECLANFMKNMNIEMELLPLAFTFSFPCRQEGLAKGVLVTWTKGFNCEGVVGEDVCELLRRAIDRRSDIKINVVAILNDTTGTLMSCAWLHRNCRIGLIIGTGSNACYVEKVENAEMFDNPEEDKPNIVINTEWGAFGNNGTLEFLRTDIDKEIDEESINPGQQIFEKFISGMYLGDMVRKILSALIRDGALFKSQQMELISARWDFNAKCISDIESDPQDSYSNCIKVLERFGVQNPTDEECAAVRRICEAISTRSAQFVAAGLATLINKMGEKDLTVGVDGSVYRFHPKYHDLLMHYMRILVNPAISFELVLSEDGSGRGAALIAAAISGA